MSATKPQKIIIWLLIINNLLHKNIRTQNKGLMLFLEVNGPTTGDYFSHNTNHFPSENSVSEREIFQLVLWYFNYSAGSTEIWRDGRTWREGILTKSQNKSVSHSVREWGPEPTQYPDQKSKPQLVSYMKNTMSVPESPGFHFPCYLSVWFISGFICPQRKFQNHFVTDSISEL